MRDVVGLPAKIVQTRDLPAYVGIGYGHAYRTVAPIARRRFRLAMPMAGRVAPQPRRGVDGVGLPFVGRVSMDSIILDVSALPPGSLKAGDLVELIGPDQTIDDIAGLAGTIGYEILTALGKRFHRVYIDETRTVR